MKEEALKLADELEKPVSVPNQHDMIYIDGHRMYGAQVIRRLVEELDKQVKPIGVYDGKNVHIYTPQVKQGEPVAWMSPDGKVSQTEGRLFYIPLYTTSQTKPLSDEEIMEIFKAYEQMQEYGYVGKKPFQVYLGWSLEDRNSCLMLARAIEERHGIK